MCLVFLRLIAVCMYRYVLTLDLRTNMTWMVTILDLQRVSLQILVEYDVMSLCYMMQLYFVYNNLIQVCNLRQNSAQDKIRFETKSDKNIFCQKKEKLPEKIVSDIVWDFQCVKWARLRQTNAYHY